MAFLFLAAATELLVLSARQGIQSGLIVTFLLLMSCVITFLFGVVVSGLLIVVDKLLVTFVDNDIPQSKRTFMSAERGFKVGMLIVICLTIYGVLIAMTTYDIARTIMVGSSLVIISTAALFQLVCGA